MNSAPHTPATGAPTLAQRLRFYDLCQECSREAREFFPPYQEGGFGHQHISNPSFGPAYNFLRVKRMREEGLPLSLLGDGKTSNQRHFEHMHRTYGAPLPWGDRKHETPLEQAERFAAEMAPGAAA